MFFILCFKSYANTPEQQPVLNREYKQWQQTGLRQGSVLFYPTLKLEGYYTDNLRAAPRNRTSDFVTSITPTLAVKTDRSDYGVDAVMQVQQLLYARTQAENNTNALLRLSPYYRMSRSLLLRTDVTYQYQHELRNADNNNPLAREPTPYDQLSAGISLLYDSGRVGAEAFLQHEVMNFRNVDLINGGKFINDDRDRHLSTAGLEMFCDISDMSRIGWRNEFYRQTYQRADFNVINNAYDGVKRDYDGWRSQMTFDLRPTGLLLFSGRIGAENRDFDDARWSQQSEWIGALKATYMFTPLTNLILEGERFIGDTAFDNAAAFTQNQARATLAHELKRNLILSFDGGYGEADYWEHDRQDQLYDGGMNITYKQNKMLHWQAGYRFQKRDSTIDAASYQENIFSVGAKVLF